MINDEQFNQIELALEKLSHASLFESLTILDEVNLISQSIFQTEAQRTAKLNERAKAELPLNNLHHSLRFSLSIDDANDLLSKLKELILK